MLKSIRGIFALLSISFLLLPLLAILPLAFTSGAMLNYPIPAVSMRWFDAIFQDEVWRRAITNSLWIGLGTTLLSTVLGGSAALALRNRLPFAGTLKTIFLLPMVVPAVVLGVGMQLTFVQLHIANSFIGVIIAHTLIAVPFVLICTSSALNAIDRRIEFAAYSLHGTPWVVFWRITLPLAMPGVVSGAVLAFATSLDEVVLTTFVAGPEQRTLSRQMFSMVRDNISPAVAAAAFMFIGGTVLVAGLVLLLRRNRTAVAA